MCSVSTNFFICSCEEYSHFKHMNVSCMQRGILDNFHLQKDLSVVWLIQVHVMGSTLFIHQPIPGYHRSAMQAKDYMQELQSTCQVQCSYKAHNIQCNVQCAVNKHSVPKHYQSDSKGSRPYHDGMHGLHVSITPRAQGRIHKIQKEGAKTPPPPTPPIR